MSDSFAHRNKCFEAREQREARKLAAEDSREKKRLKIEKEKLKLAKMEAEIKRQHAETEQIRARIEFMERLKNLGHTQEEIVQFFAEQFPKPGGGANPIDSQDESNADTTDDSDTE